MMPAETTERSARAYTVAQLSELWNCGRSTVYEMIDAGKITPFRIGSGKRGIRITEDEKRRWENSESARHTETETLPSASGMEKPLPPSALKALASA